MIGVMVPSVFAEGFFLNYMGDDPKFSIDYPYGWDVNVAFDGEAVSFYSKDSTSWLRLDYLPWSFYEARDLSKNASDNEVKLNMIQNAEEVSITMCNESEDFTCWGFEVHEIEKIKSDPPTFRATFSFLQQFQDYEFIPHIRVEQLIIEDDAYWLIRGTESPNQSFQVQDNIIKILESMDSFVSYTFEKVEAAAVIDAAIATEAAAKERMIQERINQIQELEQQQELESQQDKITQLEADQSGGGCLIATATYGSELSPQVQLLREIRDNQLLNTESGSAFMGTFNDIYYSFSPIIADYERENPYFKEAVKLAITPMISTLSLMENANSESEVLSIGISVIMLNLGMYLGIPAVVIIGIRKIK